MRLDKPKGQFVRQRSNRDAIRNGIAYVPEDRLTLGLVQPQSIAENLVMPILPQLSTAFGLISRPRMDGVVSDRISELSVKIGHATDKVSTLSGGNQQRAVLAKWLATNPQVLVLDSPTVGVDVGARAGIFRIVRDLAAQGLAILLISDEVSEVHMNADRILHMAAGRIVAEYDPRATPLSTLEAAVYA